MFHIARRAFFFIVVNIAVITTISIVLNVLGVRPYLDERGINYESLLVFCTIWGMGGAFISLLISKQMAKWSMGVKIIDPRTSHPEERWLIDTVASLAQAARIGMPEVGYYQSPDVNAFATGATKNRSLVAVSSGLLSHMNKDEAKGVLGHEIAHVANGDMVTMTLIQGVVNAFVMFLSRIVAFVLSQNVQRENRHTVQFLATIVFDILFAILGSIIVAYYSRRREFRADAGGARYAGRQNMIGALEALKTYYSPRLESDPKFASLKISGLHKGGLMALMSTHPPLEVRIAALQRAPV